MDICSLCAYVLGKSYKEAKSIEPSLLLAQLRVRHSQFRESFFSVICNKKSMVCYCFDLIGTPVSEAEGHYRKKINFEKGNPFCNNT